MNMNALTLQADSSLDDARRCLQANAQGVALIVNAQGKLLRTVTDGDLRRASLDGQNGEAPLVVLGLDKTPVTAGIAATPAQIQTALDAHVIDHMPIVNELGQVVDLVHRRDLGARVWLSSPHLGHEETAFVQEAFATNWIAPLGPTLTHSSVSWQQFQAWRMARHSARARLQFTLRCCCWA